MLKEILEFLKKEKATVKQAPYTFAIFSTLIASATFLVTDWHYDGRLDSLREQVNLYQAKLEVASPDEAAKKVMQLKQELDIAINVARAQIQKIANEQKDKNIESYAWLKPICASRDDSAETLRQILVYNLMGEKLGIPDFSDKDFCSNKYPKEGETFEKNVPAKNSTLFKMNGSENTATVGKLEVVGGCPQVADMEGKGNSVNIDKMDCVDK